MIKKILIANRGEIASRIIRTCCKMGIKTVAIYSEADEHASYVKEANEQYFIGPPRVNESYLHIDKILTIAKEAKADAIHPGYGFNSENSTFASRCKEEGIIFIGPSSDILQKMGDKIAARKLMNNAGVPTIPGSDEALSDVHEAVKIAEEIGYPVMLKASAGGGGIGLQVVHHEQELREAFESNSQRAEQFFGNGNMFIEKLLLDARHIEIQILADHFGNTIHLFDRECSIQRRNQKVIEEAPSPFLTEEIREKMGEVSVQAAKSIGYTNAGTMEYLVDSRGNFYFLEMNTRIQVEHPVTEEITGIDIVEQQIKIASGDALTLKKEVLHVTGHAIEARIYAEDPVQFYPSPGKITTYRVPEGDAIRIESSVANQSIVSPFYDPMISKLIVKGSTRDEALSLLKQALAEYEIAGIKTNLPMLRDIVEHEAFQTGNTTTDFVSKYYVPIVQRRK